MDAAASKLAALGLPKLNTYAHSKGGRGGSRPGQPSLRGGHGAGGRGGFGARPRSASEGPSGGKPQRRRTIERKLARSKGTNRMVDASSGAMMGRAAALLGAKAKLKVKLAQEGGAAVAPLTAEELAAASAPKKKKQKLASAAPVVKKAQLLPSTSGAPSEPLPDFLRAVGMGAGARDANGEAAWDLDEEMRYFEQQLGIRREKKKNKAAKAAADKAARANDPRASAADDNDSDDAELDVNALSRFRKELDEDGLGDLFDFCDLLESGKETGAREEEDQGFDMNDPDNQDEQPEVTPAAAAASASSKGSKSSKSAKSSAASSEGAGYSAARKAEILAREAAIDAKQDAMEKALEKAMAKQAARDAKIKAARAAGLPLPAEEPDSEDDEEEGGMVDERSGEEEDDEDEEDDNMTAAAIAHAAAVSRKRRRGAVEDEDEEDAADEDEDDAENDDDEEEGEDQEEEGDDDEELEDAEEEEGGDEDAEDAEEEESPAAEPAAADGKKKPSIPDLYGFSAPVPDSLLAFRRGDKNILAASAAGAAAGAGASSAAAGSVGATAAPAAPAKYVPPHLRAQLAAAAAAAAPAASPAAAAAAAVSSTSSAASLAALRRQLKGLLNRLTSANLEHIALQMTSTLYASHPKREVTELLCDELLGLCTLESEGTSGGYALGSNSSTLLASAALVVYLHSTLGSDIGAHFLERFVLAFVNFSSATAARAAAGQAPSAHAIKACTTLVTFLTYLYNFSLIGSGLIYDLLRQFLEEFRPDSIEAVLVILQNCGYQLRKEEPAVLKEIVLLIQERAKRYNHLQAVAAKTKGGSAAAAAPSSSSAASAAAVPSSFEIPEGRVSFMLDMIYDLKNNKKRHSALYDSILPLQSWLAGKLKRRATAKGSNSSAIGENQLRFGMQDIINIPTRGRWWLVGAAWKGKRMGEDDAAASGSAAASAHTPSAGAAAGSGKKPKAIILPAEDASESVDLLSLARSQHMHTDLRKSLFLVIMSSCDYMDCYEKLSKLNLPPAQLRQVIKVLLDCCAAENTWNPYYALVLLQLSRMDGGAKEMKFTAQLALWDAVKEWSESAQIAAMRSAGVKGETMKSQWLKAKQRQVLHTAKLFSVMLREPAGGNASGGGGGLPLTALKCFDFHELSSLQLLFLTACLKDFMLLSESAHIAASCLRLHTAIVDPKAAGTQRAADARLLRDGLDFFLQHHLTPTATAMATKDREASRMLVQRIASARKALAGEVETDWMFKK